MTQVTVADIKDFYKFYSLLEETLQDSGSKQPDLWGGGIDTETKEIDFDSFINIRPSDNNTSNEIQGIETRKKFEDLTKYFFKEIYEE